MNISITFRHMEPSEAIKRYANGKLAKIQKFLRRPMTAKVTLSVDQLEHVAEARISSGGEHLEAKEAGDDMYASIDSVLSKLERQIRGSKGAAQARRKGAISVRTTAAAMLAGAKGLSRAGRSTSKKAGAKKKRSAKSSR
jgi:putative sigma-54 modulation protein